MLVRFRLGTLNIDAYISWLDSMSDTHEAEGSSPSASTKLLRISTMVVYEILALMISVRFGYPQLKIWTYGVMDSTEEYGSSGQGSSPCRSAKDV